MGALTPRWTSLKYHAGQWAYWKSKARFIVCPSGRRSGKSEIAKRKLVDRAMEFDAAPNGFFVAAAPVFRQARKIFWNDLKRLVPKWAMARKPSESLLEIYLKNGATIAVMGMDAPDRIEGQILDGILLDEFGNMKESVWVENILPALGTMGREGWAMFIGVPEGRNHYYDLVKKAQQLALDEDAEWHDSWSYHHWPSWEILDPKKVETYRKLMDDLTFRQELGGEFVIFGSLAYYKFQQDIHASESITERYYDPRAPLLFCFDFNVEPGVAAVCQRIEYKGHRRRKGIVARDVLAVIGEVHIPTNSNTPAVCRRLVEDWRHHKGPVVCYGDRTGGARKTSATEGNDWDLIYKELRPAFGDRLRFSDAVSARRQNPDEKARLAAFNSRLRTADGLAHMLVDPIYAPSVVKDLEGVKTLKGGSGEIDKKATPKLTHVSDAIGYLIEEEYPVRELETKVEAA